LIWYPNPYVGDVKLRAFMSWLQNENTIFTTTKHYEDQEMEEELQVKGEWVRLNDLGKNHIQIISNSLSHLVLKKRK